MKKILITLVYTACLFSVNTNAQVALAFNGINNYVSTSGSPVLGNLPRTVDAWIKTTSTITTQMVICDWGVLSPNGSRFTLNMINSKLRIEVGGVGFAGTTNINTGQWVHVTAVYSPSITIGVNVFLYLNGVLEASGNFTGYPTLTTSSTTGFRMGVRVDGINFFTGSIDEVKVYNYPRTQSQVAADTLEYCAVQPGLVAYYKLNEGIANSVNTNSITAIDYSGNGNNGSLNSFTLSGTVSNWVPGRVGTDTPSITSNPGSNICSGATLSLSANAANSYTWSTGNSTSTVIIVTPTTTTTYSISAINSQSCLTSAFATVTVNTAPPTLTVLTAQNPICLGAATSFTASGAATYTWTGGIVNGQAFTPSITTSYTLSAGNPCGTVNSVQIVTVVPLQVTTAAIPATVCAGYTCALTAASSANGYTWSPGSQTGTNIVVTPSSSTIYTVAVTNGTCVGTQTLQVITKTTPTISIANTPVTICEGQTITLTAGGAGVNGSYLWLTVAGSGANITINPIANTGYTASGTNSLGCTSTVQTTVLVNPKPIVSAAASKTLACNGETITLNANGAATYTWSSGAISAGTSVVPVAGFNVYSVTATSSNNTCTATQTVAVAIITPSVNFTTSVSICNGGSATLSANGANSYTWNNAPSGTGQQVYSPTTTATYTLIANTQSLSTNCLSTYISTVIVNPSPTISFLPNSVLTICKGESKTLNATGAVSYTWVGVTSTSSQVIVTPGLTTTYTVTGASNLGCVSTAQVKVLVVVCNGIVENMTALKLIFYPNPAEGEFYIDAELEMTIELYDFNGQLVKTIHAGEGRTPVDVRDLSRGLYILKAQGASFVLSRKIVFQ